MAASSSVTVEDVRRLTAPTKRFLCPLSANDVGLEFLSFTISDYGSKQVLFDATRDAQAGHATLRGVDPEEAMRTIVYAFPADVLRLPTISTDLAFRTGELPLHKLTLVERHYFKGRLIKSFDFDFAFVMPNSVNTWQAVYDLPDLDDALVEDMIASPLETVSDSFYFANGRLVIHNKAYFKYTVTASFVERRARAESKLADSLPHHVGAPKVAESKVADLEFEVPEKALF